MALDEGFSDVAHHTQELNEEFKPSNISENLSPEGSRSSKSDGSRDNEEPECRICRCGTEEGPLVRPCICSGSMEFVHSACLLRWLHTRDKKQCEVCGYHYIVESDEKQFPWTHVGPFLLKYATEIFSFLCNEHIAPAILIIAYALWFYGASARFLDRAAYGFATVIVISLGASEIPSIARKVKEVLEPRGAAKSEIIGRTILICTIMFLKVIIVPYFAGILAAYFGQDLVTVAGWRWTWWILHALVGCFTHLWPVITTVLFISDQVKMWVIWPFRQLLNPNFEPVRYMIDEPFPQTIHRLLVHTFLPIVVLFILLKVPSMILMTIMPNHFPLYVQWDSLVVEILKLMFLDELLSFHTSYTLLQFQRACLLWSLRELTEAFGLVSEVFEENARPLVDAAEELLGRPAAADDDEGFGFDDDDSDIDLDGDEHDTDGEDPLDNDDELHYEFDSDDNEDRVAFMYGGDSDSDSDSISDSSSDESDVLLNAGNDDVLREPAADARIDPLPAEDVAHDVARNVAHDVAHNVARDVEHNVAHDVAAQVHPAVHNAVRDNDPRAADHDRDLVEDEAPPAADSPAGDQPTQAPRRSLKMSCRLALLLVSFLATMSLFVSVFLGLSVACGRAMFVFVPALMTPADHIVVFVGARFVWWVILGLRKVWWRLDSARTTLRMELRRRNFTEPTLLEETRFLSQFVGVQVKRWLSRTARVIKINLSVGVLAALTGCLLERILWRPFMMIAFAFGAEVSPATWWGSILAGAGVVAALSQGLHLLLPMLADENINIPRLGVFDLELWIHQVTVHGVMVMRLTDFLTPIMIACSSLLGCLLGLNLAEYLCTFIAPQILSFHDPEMFCTALGACGGATTDEEKREEVISLIQEIVIGATTWTPLFGAFVLLSMVCALPLYRTIREQIFVDYYGEARMYTVMPFESLQRTDAAEPITSPTAVANADLAAANADVAATAAAAAAAAAAATGGGGADETTRGAEWPQGFPNHLVPTDGSPPLYASAGTAPLSRSDTHVRPEFGSSAQSSAYPPYLAPDHSVPQHRHPGEDGLSPFQIAAAQVVSHAADRASRGGMHVSVHEAQRSVGGSRVGTLASEMQQPHGRADSEGPQRLTHSERRLASGRAINTSVDSENDDPIAGSYEFVPVSMGVSTGEGAFANDREGEVADERLAAPSSDTTVAGNTLGGLRSRQQM